MSGTRSTKGGTLRLRLYVAGESPNSVAAIRHLRAVLAGYPSLHAELEIIDVLKSPEAGMRARVLVTPTMVKVAPSPERRITGNLKDTNALVAVLGLTEAPRE
jgi:circadian clock protein KaiB